MTSIISILIGIGLHYMPVSRSKIIFILTEFLSGGVL